MSKLSAGEVLIVGGMFVAIDAVLDLFGLVSEQGAPAYYLGVITMTFVLVVISGIHTLLQKRSESVAEDNRV